MIELAREETPAFRSAGGGPHQFALDHAALREALRDALFIYIFNYVFDNPLQKGEPKCR